MVLCYVQDAAAAVAALEADQAANGKDHGTELSGDDDEEEEEEDNGHDCDSPITVTVTSGSTQYIAMAGIIFSIYY